MKKKGKGKPRGMNYADVLRARRDRLQLAMDEAALLNVEQGGKKRDLTARLEHLAGELADVVNVTEQIIQLFGLETDFKVARHAGIQKTLKRIREEMSNAQPDRDGTPD